MTRATLDRRATTREPARRAVPAWRGRTTRFVLAVGASALVTFLLGRSIPDLLPSQTDIVGFPIWMPFDSRRYIAIYVLWMVCFPLLATLGYSLLGRLNRGSRAARPSAPPPIVPAGTRPAWVGHLCAGSASALVLLPGCLTLGVVGAAHGWSFGVVLALSFVIGLVTLVVIAFALRDRAIATFDEAMWGLAAATAPTGFLALSVLSARTGILVTSTGSFDGVIWFPYWLGLVGTFVALGVVCRVLARRPSRDWISVGRWTLLCCAMPALLWILVGSIAPALGPIDAFHEGEKLVGSQMLLDGRFPWRDFLSTHGLLEDSLVFLPGLTWIAGSRWGAISGELVWVTPAYWVAWFAFMAYLLRKNRWLLVAWLAFVVAGPSLWEGLMFQSYLRSGLYPVVLLAMAWVVRGPSSKRIALLAGVLVLQVVVTPETGYIVAGVFIALAAFDWSRRRDVPLLRRFRATGFALLWCFAFTLVFAAYLVANDSLSSFIDYFRVFASGHDLKGGLPFVWSGRMFAFSALAPPIVFLIVIWYGIARWRARRALELDDFVMIPAFVLAALYYTKFLQRADDLHSLQSWAITVPVFWYVLARLFDFVDRAWLRHARASLKVTHGVSFVAMVVLVAVLAPNLVSQIQDTPTRFRPTAAVEPRTARIGYAVDDVDDVVFFQKTHDVAAVINAMVPGTRQVFDFTNSPAFFDFALPYTPPTRYYHVSMAISLEAQLDVIKELRRSQPQIVAGFSDAMGLWNWDLIPNMVRHYAVNRYLQTHYRPVVAIAGFVFLLKHGTPFDPAAVQRLSLYGPASFGNLDKVSYPCDWRAVPARFALHPAPNAVSTGALPKTEVQGTLRVTGWTVDPETGAPVAQVLALGSDGTVLASVVPTGNRPDVAAFPGLSAARESGFSIDVPVAAGDAVTIVARRADGALLRVGPTIGSVLSPAVGAILRVGGTASRVAPGRGSLETADLLPIKAGVRAYRVVVPGSPRDWNWLSISAQEPLVRGEYALGLPAGDGQSRFTLTRTGSTTENMMVGACNQWYDYASQVRVVSTPAAVPDPRIAFTR